MFGLHTYPVAWSVGIVLFVLSVVGLVVYGLVEVLPEYVLRLLSAVHRSLARLLAAIRSMPIRRPTPKFKHGLAAVALAALWMAFAAGCALVLYPIGHAVHHSQKEQANTTIPGHHPLLQRTIEFQFGMHYEPWRDREHAMRRFFPQAMAAFGIAPSPDAYMVLEADETCAMLYEKWDTRLRHIETARLKLRTRTCLYDVSPWGEGWNVTGHLADGSKGTARVEDKPNITVTPYAAQTTSREGSCNFDLKYWYVKMEQALESPFEPEPLYYNITTQKLENDYKICESHYSRAIKVKGMPYRFQFERLGQAAKYIPSVLTIINLPYVNDDTPLFLFSHIFKWERVQKGHLRDYPHIEFKNDIYVEYYTEKAMGEACCRPVKSLEYSIRLYSPSTEDFPRAVLDHMQRGYHRVIETGFPRESAVCYRGERALAGVGAVLIVFSAMLSAALLFYRANVTGPLLAEEARAACEMHEREMDDSSVRDIFVGGVEAEEEGAGAEEMGRTR
eukprot:TRINITY_DN12716_c0_g1_i1.p1 TRINITY_DN12716_c0_g1~~TRINITY_DN12716_c0_g1_i1.p1  ORF type:complete len:504 (-),score=187.78 TRINITY_DN12716_c0_g1_i1:346-1857(-)